MPRQMSPVERKSAGDIARRLRAFRSKSRLTQEELARAAQITPKFVSQIENGHVNASIGVLQRLIEDGLKIPLATFFGTDPNEDMTSDVSTILVLLADQPLAIRRLAIRLVRVLVDDPTDP
jgi:transcriptional regulator with XRE-family HTH domain